MIAYACAAAGLAVGFLLGALLASIKDDEHEHGLVQRIHRLETELASASDCRECGVELDGPFTCIDCSPDATVLELIRPPEQT